MGNKILKFAKGLLLTLAFTLCVAGHVETAQAATEVDTFGELEEALESTGTGTSYIKVTGNITITSKITIKKGTKVLYADSDYTLTRTGTTSKCTSYMFEVSSGATFKVGTTNGSGNVIISGRNGNGRDDSTTQSSIVKVDGGTFQLGKNGKLKNNTCHSNSSDSTSSHGGAIRASGGATVNIYGEISGCATNKGYKSNGDTEFKVGGAIYAVNTTLTMYNGSKITDCDSGSSNGGGIWMGTGAKVTIQSGSTIEACNAYVDSQTGEYSGGAIFQSSGTLNIEGGTFKDNFAENGGFLCTYGGSFNISGGIFKDNWGWNNGGVIEYMSKSTSTISGGEFYNNECEHNGGVIKCENSGTLNIKGGNFHDNSAVDAGGVLCTTNSNTVNISGGEFKDNYTDGRGGAIRVSRETKLNIGTSSSASSAKFCFNAANNGGAINSTGITQIYGAQIYNNTATLRGGGIVNSESSSSYAGTVTIGGNTSIYNNNAEIGGGIYNERGSVTIYGPAKIYNNKATNDGGGGIYNAEKKNSYISTLKITRTSTNVLPVEIYNNSAKRNGGGINNKGNLTIDIAKIYKNTAIGAGIYYGLGGGLYNESGTANIWGNSEIGSATAGSGNTATNGGGGVYNASGTVTFGAVKIQNNESSSYGGGIANASSAVIKSIGALDVSYNSASGYGGGFYNTGTYTHDPAVSITYNPNVQVVNNTSTADGSGIYNSGTFTLTQKTFTTTTLAPVFKVEGNSNTVAGDPGVCNSGTFKVYKPYKFTVTNNKNTHDDKTVRSEFKNMSGATAEIYATNAYIGEETKADAYDLYAIANAGTFTYTQASGTSTITSSSNRTIYNTGTMTINGTDGVTNITNNKEGSYIVQNNGTLNVTPSFMGVIVLKSCSGVNMDRAINNNGTLTFKGIINGNGSASAMDAALTEVSLVDDTFATALAADSGLTSTGIVNSSGKTTTFAGEIYGCVLHGIYNNGTLDVEGGLIHDNGSGYVDTDVNGGGIINTSTGTVDLNGGIISANAADNGGGIYNDGTLTQTAGTISNNTATTGNGVYMTSNCTYNVSEEAEVDKSNDVYEESGAYIKIVSPGLNIEDKVKFTVTPQDTTYDVGRIIANVEFAKDAEKQLYGSGTAEKERAGNSVVKMFAESGKKYTVRPGNRLNSDGRANLFTSVTDGVKNTGHSSGVLASTGRSGNYAIYLSEKYTVTYMPNKPTGESNEVTNMPGIEKSGNSQEKGTLDSLSSQVTIDTSDLDTLVLNYNGTVALYVYLYSNSTSTAPSNVYYYTGSTNSYSLSGISKVIISGLASIPSGDSVDIIYVRNNTYNNDTKYWYENYQISTKTPELEGWDFVNNKSWNTSADGEGDVYGRGDFYYDNADLTVYALWKNAYAVSLYHVVMDTSGSYPLNKVKGQEKEIVTDYGLNTTCSIGKTDSIVTDGKLDEELLEELICKDLIKEDITDYSSYSLININDDGTVTDGESVIILYYDREKYSVTLDGDIGISKLGVTNNDYNDSKYVDIAVKGSDRATSFVASKNFGTVETEYFSQVEDGLLALKDASLKITINGTCYNQENYLRIGSGGRYEVNKGSSEYVFKAAPGIYDFKETYEVDIKAGEVIDYYWGAIPSEAYSMYETGFPDIKKYSMEGTIEIINDGIASETARMDVNGTDLAVGDGYVEFKEFDVGDSHYFEQTDKGLAVKKDVATKISVNTFSFTVPKLYVNGVALYTDSNAGNMYYAGGPGGYKRVKYLEYTFKKGDVVTIRLPEIAQSSLDYYGSSVKRSYSINAKIDVVETKSKSVETTNKSFTASDSDEQINEFVYTYYADDDNKTSVTVSSDNKENTDFWGFSYNEDRTEAFENNPDKEQTIVLPNKDTVIYAHTLRGGNVTVNCYLQNQNGDGYTLIKAKSGEVFASSREVDLHKLLFTDDYGVVGPGCRIDGQTHFHNNNEAECVKVDGEWYTDSIAHVGEGSVIDVYFDRYTYKATFIAGKHADSVEAWTNGNSKENIVKLTKSFTYTDYIPTENAKGITVNTSVTTMIESYDKNQNKIKSTTLSSDSSYVDIEGASYVRFYTPIGSITDSTPLSIRYSFWNGEEGDKVEQTVYAYISDGSVLGIKNETPASVMAEGFGEDDKNYGWFETSLYENGTETPYSEESKITVEVPNKDISYTYAAIPEFTTVILNHYIMTEDGDYNDGTNGSEDKPDVTVLYEHMELDEDSISVLDCADTTILNNGYCYLDKVVVNDTEYPADSEELKTLKYTSNTKDTTYIKYYYYNQKTDRIKVRVFADPVYSDITVNDNEINVEEVNEGVVNIPVYEARCDVGDEVTFNPVLDESKIKTGYKFEQRKYSITTPDRATDETERTINPDSSQTLTVSPEYVDEDGYMSIYVYADIVPISYVVIYDVNLPAGETAYTGHMDNTIARYDEAFNLTKNDYKIDGYRFLGWADENDRESNTVTYEDMEEVINLASTQSAEVRLYAVWEAYESGKPNIHTEDLFFRVGEDINFDNLFEHVIISDGNGNVMDNRTAGLEIIGVSQVVNEYVNAPIYPADDAYATSNPIAEEHINNYINTDYERTFLVTVQAHNYKKNGNIDKYGKASFTVKVWQTHTISKYVRAVDLYSLDTIPLDSKWASGELNTRLITSLRKSGLEEAKYVYRFSSEDVKDIRSKFKENSYNWDAIKDWWKTTVTPLANPDYFGTLRSQY